MAWRRPHFFQKQKLKTMVQELMLLIETGKAVMRIITQCDESLKKLLTTRPDVNVNDLTFRMNIGELAAGQNFGDAKGMKPPSMIIELTTSAEAIHNIGCGIVSIRDNVSGETFSFSMDDIRGEECDCPNCVARREANKLRDTLGTTDNAVDFVNQMLNKEK